MSQGRRHFTDEFKREAVALVRPTLADRTAYAARFLAPGRSRAAFSPVRLEQQDLPPIPAVRSTHRCRLSWVDC